MLITEKPIRSRHFLLFLLPLLIFLSSGCGRGARGAAGIAGSVSALSGGKPWTPRTSAEELRLPEASGTETYRNEDGSIILDVSHTGNGYLMIKDTSDKKVQIQITNPDGEMYPYPLKDGGAYEAFPLTGGNGNYTVKVLENISGDEYAVGLSQSVPVELSDEFQPFLYPNQYTEYSADSETVKFGEQLAGSAGSDLEYVQEVYNYVIQNITYDTAFAENTPVNYIPDPDQTLRSKKGICFDYASLMTALLRSQGVPTKLVTGYSGKAYHAWISVYLREQGWVDQIIYFDGKDWTLMDPTLGASNDAEAVKKYVGDGSNYTVKYVY